MTNLVAPPYDADPDDTKCLTCSGFIEYPEKNMFFCSPECARAYDSPPTDESWGCCVESDEHNHPVTSWDDLDENYFGD